MLSMCHRSTFLKGHLCHALPLIVEGTGQKWGELKDQCRSLYQLEPLWSLPPLASMVAEIEQLSSVSLSSMRQVTGATFLVKQGA